MLRLFIISFLILISSPSLSLDTKAKQAILFDYETKSVIFEKNSDELMSPSSMSKIMTVYYLFKKIKDGELKLSDKFKVSKKAWKKGGSKMFLNVNSMVSIEDLIRGIIVQSGNDACIVVAEGISGSEKLFSEELNILAKEIGLNNSNFSNSTGWPDPDHLTTIKDLLTLTIKTIEDFPSLYHYYSEKEFTYSDIKQMNRNPLLYNDSNADGLKTGHTSLGGYGLVASVKKNDRRLILILNGLNSSKERSKESARIVKVGFNQYRNINLFDENETIKELNVWGGKKKALNVYSKERISITIPKRIKKNIIYTIKNYEPLLAPIKKDQKVAELIIKKQNNEILKKFDLYSKEEVKEMSFFSKVFYNFKYLLLGDSIFKSK
jgi:D-alanyl-D-alanine carboxypeptidase (penicillin-binding protein 5/6)